MNKIQQPPHTFVEHQQFLYDFIRLQLFFLHRYSMIHPEEVPCDILENRVDIYRKTDANPGTMDPGECFFANEPWVQMREATLIYLQQFQTDEVQFESKAFEIFRASIDRRCERDWLDRSNLVNYQCGSLRHELQLRENKVMFFHIANAIAPKSFLDETKYLGGCFLQLLNTAENEYGAEYIATRSWLNSLPKWLDFFPIEYLKSRQAPNLDIRWYGSFWGQFINARGTFNHKYAKIMRQTGDFPYYPCYAQCSIALMRRHLNSIFY